MTKLNQIFRCSICGNIVNVLHESGGTLLCCGQPMDIVEENTTDAAGEKHVPVIEHQNGNAKIKIGSIPHPMENSHFIEWIQVLTDEGRTATRYLKPGEAPEAAFNSIKPDKAREFCNLHGLWSASA